jgi:hypothetical protein
MLVSWLAIRLDFGLRLVESPDVARAVGEVLVRPCFAELSRMGGRRKDRWSRHRKPSAEAIASYLTDPNLDAVSLDTKRSQAIVVASAEVENGIRERGPSVPPETRHPATIVIPYVTAELEAVTSSVCDLARTVRAAAGYIALEPKYGWAHEVALGGARPRERVGLSEQRFRERRGRGWHDDRLVAELAGVEWGNFLGPGHLARLDLGQVRASGAFARVVELGPQLAYLQVSEDPAEDLTEGFEDRLVAARRVLAPVLMDVSGVSLE